MAKYIRTLTVYYDANISSKEIPYFRGAVLKSMGGKANILYHNHIDTGSFRYSYPLIQYKRLGGKAAIVCIEEGADVIGQFLTEVIGTISIGERKVKLQTCKIVPARILVQTWGKTFKYHISRWLPLNAKNYHNYQMADNQDDKTKLLERILKGNLLSMLKGLGIYLESELSLHISDIGEPRIIYNKGIGLMAFDADFQCNLSIPNNVGVGKNASIGCGVLFQIKEKQEKSIEDE